MFLPRIFLAAALVAGSAAIASTAAVIALIAALASAPCRSAIHAALYALLIVVSPSAAITFTQRAVQIAFVRYPSAGGNVCR